MSLRAELADPARLGDTVWLLSKFKETADKYADFNDRTEAAETLSLWSQRYIKATQQLHDKEADLASGSIPDSILKNIDEVLFLMIDRWSNGNPSYILALRKSMQCLLVIREHAALTDSKESIIPQLVKHAADYARDDPRIAFGSIEAMARSSITNCTKVRESLPSQFVTDAFKILVGESSRSGMVGRSLVIVLGTNLPPRAWFDYTKPYIGDVKHYQAIMTYFIEPMLKQHRNSMEIFNQFYELCSPQSTPSVEIGVLKAAKNAKLDVGSQIQSSEAVRSSLSSISRNLRYDALTLLCGATRKLTSPVPSVVFEAIIANAPSLLAEGEPRSRAEVCGAFRNLLIRVNTSKSQENATSFVKFITEWCAQSLLPGMPYRCLTMATKLLELFVQYNFKDDVLTPNVVKGLVNCVASDFADIRESCVMLLGNVPVLPQVDSNFETLVEHGFKLIQGGRTGDSGARLLEFLNGRKPEADLGDRVAEKLESLLSIARKDLLEAARGRSIYGYIIALRIVPPRHYKLIPLMAEIWRICSPPLMIVAPEGSAEDLTNYCWKAIKESSLLVESIASSYQKTDGADDIFQTVSIDVLLEEAALMLTDITHWGAFSAVPPAYTAIARLNPDKAMSLVWKQLKELESREKSRSVTRRSAGLPLLITSTLSIRFDHDVVEALFDLATLPFVDGEWEELEMPQVHGMNCLRAVVTDSEITKDTAKYLERALELSLDQFRSSVWSLRNCAAMMFTSLFKRFFGVRGLPVPASVFFQRFRKLQPLISDQLYSTTKNSDLQAVYPALAILSKLQTVSKDDQSLAQFWEPVVELLGSPSWKIREISAKAVVSMTHVDIIDDVVSEFVRSLNMSDQNQMHGFALAMNGLLNIRATAPMPDIDQLSMDALTKRKESTLSILRKVISVNKCMETNTELFKAWRKLGGRSRLIPFENLPRPQFLNPSVDTFESEQIKESPAKVENYAHGWSQVLRNLPSDKWSIELANEVLSDETQLPDLQSLCLQTLMKSPLASELTELALSLLIPSRPICVRQEALVLASQSPTLDIKPELFDRWLENVVEFSRDEAPIESRRSAIRSIGVYFSRINSNQGHHVNNELLYTLFRLLSDEEEDIREHGALVASRFLEIPQPQAPQACELALLSKMDPKFITDQLQSNLVEDCKRARSTFESPNELIFIVEKESLYRDELRNIFNQAEFCEKSSESRAVAEEAAQVFDGLDFSSPLQAGASSELAEMRARINALN